MKTIPTSQPTIRRHTGRGSAELVAKLATEARVPTAEAMVAFASGHGWQLTAGQLSCYPCASGDPDEGALFCLKVDSRGPNLAIGTWFLF